MTDRFGKRAAAGSVPGLLLASVAPAIVVAPLTVTFAAHAQEVVQALPDPASGQLAEALRILSRSPNSLPALIDAARASLQLNDGDAAEGFIDRARAIAPQDGAVLATQALLAVKRQFATFDEFIWQFVDGRPLQNRRQKLADVPAQTPQSEAMSKELKRRGFRFVGPTICYAFMQAVGMVNDHQTNCFRHEQLK